MVEPKFYKDPDTGELVELPSVGSVDDIETPVEESDGDGISDLFDVTDEDIIGDENGVEDLVTVSDDDVIGHSPRPKVKYKRINRRIPPTTSLGGMR